MNAWFYGIAAVGLLGLSGLVSASETAFFSLRPEQRSQMAADPRLRYQAAGQLLRQPQRLLMTLLLGNLLINLYYLSLATALSFSLKRAGASLLATGVVVSALLALILFGEVVPKIIARSKPVLLTSFVSIPVLLSTKALAPVVRMLAYFTERMTVAFLGTSRGESGRQQFLKLADLSKAHGEIAEHQRRILHEVLEFGELRVSDVMVPRVDVIGIDLAAPRFQVEQVITTAKRSRLLAYQRNLDQVEGQLIAHQVLLRADRSLSSLVKPVPAVPEQASAEAALNLLRSEGATLALVVDEFGGTAGIITVHDILEEIVGELTDEHHARGREIVETEDGRAYVLGRIPFREWREHSDETEAEESISSLGGFLMERLDHTPQVGDELTTGCYHYRICRVQRGRILLVEATRRVEQA